MQASEMSTVVKSYFSHLTATVPAHHWQQWEWEIKDAESCWLVDPAVMDILCTCDAPRDDESIPAFGLEAHTCTEMWIQKAINIEERQCVAFHLNLSPC